MIARVLVALAAAALAGSTAMAGPVHGIMLSRDGGITSIVRGSGIYMAPPTHDGAQAIFSNLGTRYPMGLYFCCSGATVSGPDSALGFQSWPAMEFTPSTDATVTELDLAIEWISGTNEVDLGLYTDAGGIPGTLLKTFKASGLQSVGGCCSLAVGKDKEGIPITAGTPYWVAATTARNAPDTFGSWEFNSTDQVDAVPSAVNKGSGWVTNGGAVPAASFAVYGN